jgi:heat shock protein HslJ
MRKKMKNQGLFLLVIVAALLMGCKSTGGGNITSFSDVIGKEWKLIEVQVDSTPFNRIVLYDRNDLKKHNIGNVYTLNFNNEMISGTAAPNKYSAPYTRGDKNSLTTNVMRSTQMAPIIQPEKLQENDFYNYMQRIESWSSDKGNLILHSKNENGVNVRLIFTL